MFLGQICDSRLPLLPFILVFANHIFNFHFQITFQSNMPSSETSVDDFHIKNYWLWQNLLIYVYLLKLISFILWVILCCCLRCLLKRLLLDQLVLRDINLLRHMRLALPLYIPQVLASSKNVYELMTRCFFPFKVGCIITTRYLDATWHYCNCWHYGSHWVVFFRFMSLHNSRKLWWY